MSKLKIDREGLISDIVAFPLMKSNEKAVIDVSEQYVKDNNLQDIFLVDEETFVGVEVEVEGITGKSAPDLLPFWGAKEDGSLRNNGIEFVSTPVRGKGLVSALHKLDTALSSAWPKHDFSERTSIHVHMNVRNLSVEALFNLLLIYMIFESALYKAVFDMCGRKRDENIFCVPIQETGKSILSEGVLHDFETGRNKAAFYGLIEGWRKYSGLNVVPAGSFGTIEFRHLGGIQDFRKILEWINMLLTMKNYAVTHSYEFLKPHIMELNTNSMYELFTRAVFNQQADNILKYNVKEELERGVIFVKYLFSKIVASASVTEQKFDGSSMKLFLEKKNKKAFVALPEKEQKKSLSEMTLAELESKIIEISSQMVEVEVQINLIRYSNRNTDNDNSQDLLDEFLRRRGMLIEEREEYYEEHRNRLKLGYTTQYTTAT